MEEIVNKVAQSGLITLDLADYHETGPREIIDIKDQLFKGLLLREKDFRNWVAETDWSEYKDKHVAIYCSNDAIIPVWAYMLLTTALEPFALNIVFGDSNDLEQYLFKQAISGIDFNQFKDKKVVVKGCGDIEIPTSAFVELTRRLRPLVDKLMYGEPCSTVPVYRKPVQKTARKGSGNRRPRPKLRRE